MVVSGGGEALKLFFLLSSQSQASVEQLKMTLWCNHMGLKFPDKKPKQNTHSSSGMLLMS